MINLSFHNYFSIIGKVLCYTLVFDKGAIFFILGVQIMCERTIEGDGAYLYNGVGHLCIFLSRI